MLFGVCIVLVLCLMFSIGFVSSPLFPCLFLALETEALYISSHIIQLSRELEIFQSLRWKDNYVILPKPPAFS